MCWLLLLLLLLLAKDLGRAELTYDYSMWKPPNCSQEGVCPTIHVQVVDCAEPAVLSIKFYNHQKYDVFVSAGIVPSRENGREFTVPANSMQEMTAATKDRRSLIVVGARDSHSDSVHCSMLNLSEMVAKVCSRHGGLYTNVPLVL